MPLRWYRWRPFALLLSRTLCAPPCFLRRRPAARALMRVLRVGPVFALCRNGETKGIDET